VPATAQTRTSNHARMCFGFIGARLLHCAMAGCPEPRNNQISRPCLAFWPRERRSQWTYLLHHVCLPFRTTWLGDHQCVIGCLELCSSSA
jgi:hypothetical protein